NRWSSTTSGTGSTQHAMSEAMERSPTLHHGSPSAREGRHRANLDRTFSVEHRAAARQFARFVEISRLDDHEARHDVLRFEERAIRNDAPLAAQDGAGSIERLA